MSSFICSLFKQYYYVLLAAVVLTGLLFTQLYLVHAADSSITINSVVLTLETDDDDNGMANIGDTVRVVVDLSNTDEACDSETVSTTVTADLTAYGGESDEALTCVTPSDGTNDIWRIDFEIVNAGGDGIDVVADSASSVVEVSATDEDEETPTTDSSNNLAEAVDTIAPTITTFEVTGGSGTDGAFIVGDTVTVTWDNSGDGDNNSDTIATTTVLFFGDELVVATEEDDIWTATLEIDSIDDLEDTGLNITVSVTDNADNSTSTGTDDVDVDNVAPGTPEATPPASSFARTKGITLASTGSDSIRYTTDGTTPTCSSGTVYASSFTINATLTVKAIGCDEAGNSSGVASISYTRTSSGNSSSSGSTKKPDMTTPAPAAGKSVAEIVQENRALLLQAQALGLKLPQFILDVLGVNPPAGMLARDLTMGATGADVQALQALLIARGHAIPAGATSYFGAQTQAALVQYQNANGIKPAAGYFGALTRAHMKSAGLSGLWW